MNDEDTMTLPKIHDRRAPSRPKTTMITGGEHDRHRE
jgi:hypothetical protein